MFSTSASLLAPTTTLAGAPPSALLKAGACVRDKPPTVGTKSINNSPNTTIPAIAKDAPKTNLKKKKKGKRKEKKVVLGLCQSGFEEQEDDGILKLV